MLVDGDKDDFRPVDCNRDDDDDGDDDYIMIMMMVMMIIWWWLWWWLYDDYYDDVDDEKSTDPWLIKVAGLTNCAAAAISCIYPDHRLKQKHSWCGTLVMM